MDGRQIMIIKAHLEHAVLRWPENKFMSYGPYPLYDNFLNKMNHFVNVQDMFYNILLYTQFWEKVYVKKVHFSKNIDFRVMPLVLKLHLKYSKFCNAMWRKFSKYSN